MTATLDGGCACGEVRYRLESPPIIVHCCHCRFCQRMGGSAFGLNAMIEADRVTMLTKGAPEPVDTPSTHPKGQLWHRCPSCRLSLWSTHPELGPRIALVQVGSLDRAEGVTPDVHCWTASKHPWIALPEGVPAFPGDYDADAVWSDQAKARLAAALA